MATDEAYESALVCCRVRLFGNAADDQARDQGTDLTEDVVRELACENALVDNKVCAIDDTWSGLRLVIRLEDRPAR